MKIGVGNLTDSCYVEDGRGFCGTEKKVSKFPVVVFFSAKILGKNGGISF